MFIVLLFQIIPLPIFLYMSPGKVQEIYISYLLLYNNVTTNSAPLKDRYLLAHSFLDQESQNSLAGSSASGAFHETAIKMSARSGVSSDGSTEEEAAPKFMWFLVGVHSCGLLDQSPHSSTVCLPSAACYMVFSRRQPFNVVASASSKTAK